MPFRIRDATPEDGPAASEVVRIVFEEYGFTWDEEDYASDLRNLGDVYLAQGDRFWVAEMAEPRGSLKPGELVATCALERFDRLPGEPGSLEHDGDNWRAAGADCALQRLYVLPQARNLGLGAAMLQRAIDAARAEGRTHMEIWSDKKLTLAHRLYERFGAVRVGERICDDPDQSPEWGMVLALGS